MEPRDSISNVSVRLLQAELASTMFHFFEISSGESCHQIRFCAPVARVCLYLAVSFCSVGTFTGFVVLGSDLASILCFHMPLG